MNRRKSLIAILVLVAVMSVFVLAGCNGNKDTVSVSIKDKSVTEVYEGGTLQLEANKDPASTQVVWVSSDEEVATVSENGLVTGVKAGTASISVKVGSAEKDKIQITVKPYTVDIDEAVNAVVYITKTVQLTATSNPANAAVTWTSSDDEIATVSENGLVTGVKAGSAVIVAACGSASDSITITVKDTVIDASANADKFDMSGLYQDAAVLKGSENSFAKFNGQPSKYYVASATVKVLAPSEGDTWSRVGISHYNGEKYYGLQLSPGPAFNARKTVTMIIDGSGNVEWGRVTDRSQVWGQHNLSAINFDSVKLTSVRSGNEFYAFINDELYYYENGIDGFTDADTLPVLNLGSCGAEFSEMQVSFGQENAERYLATADDSVFYASSDKVIIDENGNVKFTGAKDQSAAGNPKDHAAKSIGAKAMLPANLEGSVSFDLTIDAIGGKNPMPALAVTLNRYDGVYAEARSLVVAQYQAGWTGWNSNGDLNEGIGGPNNYQLNGQAARLEEGSTYKITVTRLMTQTGGEDSKLSVRDADGNVLFEGVWGWDDGYTGRVSVSFLCRDLDCTLSNIVIK